MSSVKNPSIAILLASGDGGLPRVSALTGEIADRLKAHGATVALLAPDTDPVEIAAILPRHDLYVVKEKSGFNLSLAGALALAGAKIVNSASSCVLARDKIAATVLVAAAGIPVPPSWATGNSQALAAPAEYGALWLKPQRGSRGAGVRRIVDPCGLPDERPVDRHGLPLALFAQREVPGDGQDFKVYVAGEKVWALRRPFPALTLEAKKGTPVLVSSRIKEIALACGRALGLELYGVDFLLSGNSCYVVDVNAFPGYKGIAEAPSAIAAYIYYKAQRCGQQCAGEGMAL